MEKIAMKIMMITWFDFLSIWDDKLVFFYGIEWLELFKKRRLYYDSCY